MSETQPITADPLDRLLTVSLGQRPEANVIPNLAERAVARARELDRFADQQRTSLAIHRWRLRLVYGAAVLLIGLLVLAGGHRLLSERQSMTTSDETISSTESSTSNTSTYVAWIGGLLFICTLAGLATQGAISNDRQPLGLIS